MNFRKLTIAKTLIACLTCGVFILLAAESRAEELFGPKIIGQGYFFYTYEITTDGSQVVYGIGNSLWKSDIDGGSATKIAQLDKGIIEEISISPDDQRIVFRGLETTLYDQGRYPDYRNGLYGVNIDGSDVVTYFDPPLTDGTPASLDFEISPDSQRVVYSLQNSLYSQAIEGGNEYFYIGSERTFSFKIASNSSRIIFLKRDQAVATRSRLFSALLSGGPIAQLSDSTNTILTTFSNYEISPNNEFVVFEADQIGPIGGPRCAIYRTPLAGGDILQLSDSTFSDAESPIISPDGARIIYVSNGDLYSVAITGGASIRLNASSPATIFTGQIFPDTTEQISPDGTTVVFLGSEVNSSAIEVYSVGILGGTPVKLNAPLIETGSQTVNNFLISPDSSYVVYLADQERNLAFELYAAPIGGGNVVKLNNTVLPGGDVLYDFQISENNMRVVFLADESPIPGEELFSVRADGSDNVLLATDIDSFKINSTSTRVINSAQINNISGRNILKTVGIDGPLKSDSFCFVAKGQANQVIPICL